MLLFLNSVLPVIILTIFSLVSIQRFKKFMRIKRQITRESRDNLDKKENSFFRMTLIVTVLFALTRTTDMISNILQKYFFYKNGDISDETKAVIDLVKQITMLMMISCHTFNACIYVGMDSNLISLLRRIVGISKDVNYFKIFMIYLFVINLYLFDFCFFLKRTRKNHTNMRYMTMNHLSGLMTSDLLFK